MNNKENLLSTCDHYITEIFELDKEVRVKLNSIGKKEKFIGILLRLSIYCLVILFCILCYFKNIPALLFFSLIICLILFLDFSIIKYRYYSKRSSINDAIGELSIISEKLSLYKSYIINDFMDYDEIKNNIKKILDEKEAVYEKIAIFISLSNSTAKKVENNGFDDESSSALETLKNKVWKTWHTRVMTAQRLSNCSKRLDFYSTIYTIALCIVNYYMLFSEQEIKTSFIFFEYASAAFSIIVMSLVFYGNSMNFKDRQLSVENNYKKLSKLYFKLDNVILNGNADIERLSSEYIDLVNECENHSRNDYVKAMLGYKHTKDLILRKELIVYYVWNTFKYLILILSLLVPIICIVYTFFSFLI